MTMTTMLDLAVVIINYRTPELVIGCLETLVPQLDAQNDCVVVVDNASGDGSDDAIEQQVRARGWSGVVTIVRSPRNGGFSAGNNVGIRAVDAARYLLLNSDTLVRDGAIAHLKEASKRHPEAGIISPRLEWPDGRPQVSCFRNRSPLTEFLRAASLGVLSRLAGGREVGIPVTGEPTEPDWTSFAAALIRREAIDDVGLLDERYFMYFEDIDFCRRARAAGWTVWNEPKARIVHLRGGSSSVKSDAAKRRRLPRYYYESRSRYFAKFYGRTGLWLTNALWTTGAVVATLKRFLGGSAAHICQREWTDNWINTARPLRGGVEVARRSDRPRLPNFIIIGAMKAATSTLHEQLARQPGIHMSTPKEPNFFSDDGQFERGVEWYASLFAGASHEDLCGESSTHYTKRPAHPDTVERMREFLPAGVRFIYVIRHPIDRLISQYIHEWTQRTIRCGIDEAIERHPMLVDYSRYAFQVEPFLTAFGHDHVLPVYFERIRTDPEPELRRIAKFIGHRSKVRWIDNLGTHNASAQRLRRSAWRDAIIDAPLLATFRKRVVPQVWRDRVKKFWTMTERPTIAESNQARLTGIFDAEFDRLGSWLGVRLTCGDYRQQVHAPDVYERRVIGRERAA